MNGIDGNVAHFFKALEQTERAEKFITEKFLKKLKLKNLVEEDEKEQGETTDADADQDEVEGASSSSSSSSSSGPVVVFAERMYCL